MRPRKNAEVMVQIGVKVPVWMPEALTIAANMRRIKVSELIREVLESYLSSVSTKGES